MLTAILLAGFVLGAAVGWLAGRWRAAAALMRVNRAIAQEARYWQEAAARATERAQRATEEAKTWADGCRQGRQDVISIVPLLMAARERATSGQDPGDAAGCS